MIIDLNYWTFVYLFILEYSYLSYLQLSMRLRFAIFAKIIRWISTKLTKKQYILRIIFSSRLSHFANNLTRFALA